MKTIGIVGCGAIGKALIRAIHDGKVAATLVGVNSRSEGTAREFLAAFAVGTPYLSLGDLIASADLVVEAAGGAVVSDLAERVFAAGKDLMVISVGALLDHPEIIERSRRSGCKLYVPSGAIAFFSVPAVSKISTGFMPSRPENFILSGWTAFPEGPTTRLSSNSNGWSGTELRQCPKRTCRLPSSSQPRMISQRWITGSPKGAAARVSRSYQSDRAASSK